MPRACSWSVAITRPPASGWSRRSSSSRSLAWPSTAGSHSPRRARCAAVADPTGRGRAGRRRRRAGAVGASTPYPPIRGKYTGRTTRRRARLPRSRTVVGRQGLVRRSGRTGFRPGVGAERGARRASAGRRTPRTPCSTPSPQARSWPGMVDLVEDHQGVWPKGRTTPAALGGDLLVGGHQAVDVGGRAAVGRRPVGIQLEAEAVAATAHWTLRWLSAARRRAGDRGAPAASGQRAAAARAKVVLPAPGVATARKSGPGRSWKGRGPLSASGGVGGSGWGHSGNRRWCHPPPPRTDPRRRPRSAG